MRKQHLHPSLYIGVAPRPVLTRDATSQFEPCLLGNLLKHLPHMRRLWTIWNIYTTLFTACFILWILHMLCCVYQRATAINAFFFATLILKFILIQQSYFEKMWRYIREKTVFGKNKGKKAKSNILNNISNIIQTLFANALIITQPEEAVYIRSVSFLSH